MIIFHFMFTYQGIPVKFTAPLIMPSEKQIGGDPEIPLKKADEYFTSLLCFPDEAQQLGQPVSVRRISDDIFKTIEASKRVARQVLQDREMILSVSVEGDPGNIDSEELYVSAAAVVAVMSAAHVANAWNELPITDREVFRQEVTKRLIDEMQRKQYDVQQLMQDPTWNRVLREFLADTMNTEDEGLDILEKSLPPNVLQSGGFFSVEIVDDQSSQIGSIVAATLHRLHKLCGEDRKTVRSEIAGWERWKNHLITPSAADIPRLMEIYQNVRIPYEWFADLVARQPEVREAALDRIRKYGGFIHESVEEDYSQMLQSGVLRMTDDASAYYGVITDRNVVEHHLQQMCGFNPLKSYLSDKDLPTKSDCGWDLEWNADPAYALSMFQHPHQVALSVEVAVMREESSHERLVNGRGRRNAGVAAALKHNVYTDPSVEQAWVLTRHFQIVEVGIPDMERPRELISGAVNVGSDVFIRMLGGREIGSAREKACIQVPDKMGKMHDVDLTIRWIFCLAPRKTSLDAIEHRGQRM